MALFVLLAEFIEHFFNHIYQNCINNSDALTLSVRGSTLDVRFWHQKSIPTLKIYSGRRSLTYVLKWSRMSYLRHLWWFQIEKTLCSLGVYTNISASSLYGWIGVSCIWKKDTFSSEYIQHILQPSLWITIKTASAESRRSIYRDRKCQFTTDISLSWNYYTVFPT